MLRGPESECMVAWRGVQEMLRGPGSEWLHLEQMGMVGELSLSSH